MADPFSTWPGAVGALSTHFENIQAANTPLQLGVYVGLPEGSVENNFLMVGDWQEGGILTAYHSEWQSLGGRVKLENYGLKCSVRVWAGSDDPLGRLNDINTLMSAVQEELMNDPAASGTITTGWWILNESENPVNGPLEGGFGSIVTFVVAVENVRLNL